MGQREGIRRMSWGWEMDEERELGGISLGWDMREK